MAKKRSRFSGWSPNITSSGVTGGTAYAPSPAGSFTPGAPSGAAPSSAPAAITPTQSKPVDSNFKDAQYNLDTGGIITGAGQTASEFGAKVPEVTYDEKGNPTLGSAQVDWSNPDGVAKLNPFSRAALLIRSYQQGVQGTSNSYAARGQHSSGAYQRAQNSNQFGFEQGKSGINTALQNFITGANQGLGQATINAIDREAGKPPTLVPGGSTVNAQGTSTYGNLPGGGQQSANQMLAAYGGRPDQTTGDPYKAPGGLPTGKVQLANGWTLVYVNGKPKFIPPGGSA